MPVKVVLVPLLYWVLSNAFVMDCVNPLLWKPDGLVSGAAATAIVLRPYVSGTPPTAAFETSNPMLPSWAPSVSHGAPSWQSDRICSGAWAPSRVDVMYR